MIVYYTLALLNQHTHTQRVESCESVLLAGFDPSRVVQQAQSCATKASPPVSDSHSRRLTEQQEGGERLPG